MRILPLLFVAMLPAFVQAQATKPASQPARVAPAYHPADALPKVISATDAHLKFVGRFDTTDPAKPKCAWSHSSVTVRFSNSSAVNANLASDNAGDRWHVIVDGEPTQILPLTKGSRKFSLAKSLTPGEHTIMIVKRGEAFTGTTTIESFEFDDSVKLLPPPQNKLKLEVIGDSISAGYGNEADNQNEKFSNETENAYLTYGAITARAIGADYVCIAWSGRKMWPNNTVPEIYDRTLPRDKNSTHNFSKWTADLVVINLATNDFGPGNPEEEGWVNAYKDFVSKVRQNYPNARIYLALGPMLSDKYSKSKNALTTARNYIQRVIKESNDPKVSFVEFPTQTGKYGFGADWHPSAGQQNAMAQVLIKQIQADLKAGE